MGFSEIFAMLASFEYAYFAAPRSAQTLFMSLRFCSVGIASFIGAAYIAVFPEISWRSTSTVSMEIESNNLSFTTVCSNIIFSCGLVRKNVRIYIFISSVLPVFN